MLFTRALLGLLAATLALAAPIADASPNTDSPKHLFARENRSGHNNGYYYSSWSQGSGHFDYNNLHAGGYRASWENIGNFVVGKGWYVGTARTIRYTADFKPQGNAYLSLYGWSKLPTIEYYVVETFGSFNPSSGTQKLGSVTTDGGTYDIHTTAQYNKASIDGAGTSNFRQFWSVRREKRTSGTITLKNHFAAWAKAGLKLGSQMSYQIMATEGYQSSGRSTVTILSPPGDAP